MHHGYLHQNPTPQIQIKIEFQNLIRIQAEFRIQFQTKFEIEIELKIKIPSLLQIGSLKIRLQVMATPLPGGFPPTGGILWDTAMIMVMCTSGIRLFCLYWPHP